MKVQMYRIKSYCRQVCSYFLRVPKKRN